MDKRRAFTLVELLVVIAIIALLMSILMPALARVRKQAKAVLCQSNLKQWGTVFQMYATDNDSYLVAGSYCTGGGDEERLKQWMDALRQYYMDGDFRLCPEAIQPEFENGVVMRSLGTFTAWGIYPEDCCWWSKGDYGSYGINGWAMNPGEDESLGWLFEKEFWRRVDVRGADNVPLFLDSQHFDTYPTNYSQAPVFEGQPWTSTQMTGEMERVCINRHDGGVNCVFLDSSVRKVGLKELWKIRWHRTFRLDFDEPIWPPWMERLKDY
ncbi:MAG: type II secretion system protein [Planctomycetota bacterium]|nr:MAG: type II secretion system protein [Planctomycetota bacterium]